MKQMAAMGVVVALGILAVSRRLESHVRRHHDRARQEYDLEGAADDPSRDALLPAVRALNRFFGATKVSPERPQLVRKGRFGGEPGDADARGVKRDA